MPTALIVVVFATTSGVRYSFAVPCPGTGVLPSEVYQMLVLLPLSASATVCDPVNVIDGGNPGAALVTVPQFAPVLFPICLGGALVGGLVSWCMSVPAAAI